MKIIHSLLYSLPNLLPQKSVRPSVIIRMMSSTSSANSPPSLLQPAEALSLHKCAKFLDGSWHMTKARSAQAEYLEEHIPGARYFDIDDVSDKSSSLPHMMPSAELFASTMDSMGISNTDHIVVYTKPNCFSGARLWWMCRAFGHRNVSILNGGLAAWKEAGGAVQSLPEMSAALTTSGAPYKATLNKKLIASLSDIQRVVDTGIAQICDARSAGRFVGTAPEPRPGLEGGHIPGSLNLPFSLLVEADDMTKFKTPADIRDAFKDAGVIFGSKIITSCGSGVTAAVLTLGLDLLGQPLENCPIYDASWSEYGDPSLDVPRMKE
jgi:thiosulfate/3-mercaptopyruvate sulfurtransferase